MQIDKKIEEYLERAKKIARNPYDDIAVIEIAKMIQLEEHREQYPNNYPIEASKPDDGEIFRGL